MKSVYKASTLALSMLSVFAANPAYSAGPHIGGSSNTSNVKVGTSDVFAPGAHTPGRAGIAVRTVGNAARLIDLQGVAGFSSNLGTSNGVAVYQFSNPNPPGAPPETHTNMGVFSFAKVGAGDVWFGEWSADGQAGGFTDRTVYYVGDKAGTTMPSGGTATYAVKGINKLSSNGDLMSGTFTANFGANTLSGSIANSGLTVAVNANISGSGFNGSATANGANGVSQGQFYGNQAAALAGIATFAGNSQYDTAFGGSKQP